MIALPANGADECGRVGKFFPVAPHAESGIFADIAFGVGVIGQGLKQGKLFVPVGNMEGVFA